MLFAQHGIFFWSLLCCVWILQYSIYLSFYLCVCVFTYLFYLRVRPYWCPKTMKQWPCWCSKQILWETNSLLMQPLSFVLINWYKCWLSSINLCEIYTQAQRKSFRLVIIHHHRESQWWLQINKLTLYYKYTSCPLDDRHFHSVTGYLIA